MKYLCLGYLDVESWSKKNDAEQLALMDDCFAYDEYLKKNGYWVVGEGLQGAETATTLRYQGGSIKLTDGPFAETKELLGGLIILEARDQNHAIQLLSNHPGAKMGPWEIRPIQDMSEIVEASKQRRAAQK
jgi:hypothetical protein